MNVEDVARGIKRVYYEWPERHSLLFCWYLKKARPDLFAYGCAGHKYERIKAWVEEVDRTRVYNFTPSQDDRRGRIEMANDTYTLSQYVADLQTITAETQDDETIVERVKPFAKRLALNKDWVESRYYTCDEEQGFGVHLLHEEPDHTLAVFALAWLPDRGTPAHDHGTWAVVAGIDGDEKNTFWKRTDDGSRSGYAELKWNGERVYGPGEVVSLLPHEIHTVWNHTDAVTLSLHTYGKHINFTGRSQFDPERRTQTPYVVKEQ